METTWLACGHVASLPMQSTQVTTEKPTDPKEESSVSSSDEEERALGSERSLSERSCEHRWFIYF